MAIFEVPFAPNHGVKNGNAPRIAVTFASVDSQKEQPWIGLVDTGSAVVAAPLGLMRLLGLSGGIPSTYRTANGTKVMGILVPTTLKLEGGEICGTPPRCVPGARLTVKADVFYSDHIKSVLLGRQSFLELLSPGIPFHRRVVLFDTGSSPLVKYDAPP